MFKSQALFFLETLSVLKTIRIFNFNNNRNHHILDVFKIKDLKVLFCLLENEMKSLEKSKTDFD
jgi:hypothetical protein